MHRKASILILFILAISCTNKKSNTPTELDLLKNTFVLDGRIPDCDACPISIAYDGMHGSVRDSVTGNDGRFTFSGTLSEPQVVELTYAPDQQIQVFLANDELSEIEVDAKNQSYTVARGQSASDFLRYRALLIGKDLEITELTEQLNAYFVYR